MGVPLRAPLGYETAAEQEGRPQRDARIRFNRSHLHQHQLEFLLAHCFLQQRNLPCVIKVMLNHTVQQEVD